MSKSRSLALASSLLAGAGLAEGQAPSRLEPDAPIRCGACEAWNGPRQPFRIFGDTYFVGPADLSSLLLAGDQGLILVDGALPQSAAIIDANIRALGFRTTDVKLILTSHAHFDHAGGLAALQRLTGATVAASAASARALALGHPTPDDPQFDEDPSARDFPAVKDVRVVGDREVLRLGRLAVTAHYTPGHTPGATSWSWRSCEGERCLDVVYGDSLTAVSSDGFRFSDPSRAGLVLGFRRSIARMAELPCDVLVTTHPGAAGLDEKLRRRAEGVADAFVDSGACRAYGARALKGLEERLRAEGVPR